MSSKNVNITTLKWWYTKVIEGTKTFHGVLYIYWSFYQIQYCTYKKLFNLGRIFNEIRFNGITLYLCSGFRVFFILYGRGFYNSLRVIEKLKIIHRMFEINIWDVEITFKIEQARKFLLLYNFLSNVKKNGLK